MNNNKAAKYLLSLVSIIIPSLGMTTNYYIDPIRGANANSGSIESPWHSLAEVFSQGKNFNPGDIIYLLSGDHGAPEITGLNSGWVKIMPLPGETPVAQSIRFKQASYWDLSGLAISPKVAISTAKVPVNVLLNIDANSKYNHIHDCNIFSDFIIDKWSAQDWQKNAYPGVWIAGPNNIFKNNHIQNIKTGIHTDFSGKNNLISGNIIENFGRDGIQETGRNNTFEYNYIVNAFNIEDGNHGDGFQAYGSGDMSGTTINGNIIISALKHPNPALYDGRLQGIGLFSSYKDYVVQNNVVMNDHRIGIWLLGGINCKVINNTVLQNGAHAATGGGPSGIRLWWTQGSGAPARNGVNNIVENNIAGEFGLKNPDNSSVCTTSANCSNNLTTRSRDLFLNAAVGDLHIVNDLKVVNAGDPSFMPPTDADGVARSGRPDLGAYEYVPGLSADTTAPSIPQSLKARYRAKLGVSLTWNASTDNRKVAGYDIYRNGSRIGRVRVGTSFVDPITQLNPQDQYSVRAFDYSLNVSAPSISVNPKA